MSKLKRHKGLLKRVRITARGRVKHKRPGTSHLMSGTPGGKVRQLGRPVCASRATTRTLARMLHRPLKGREQA